MIVISEADLGIVCDNTKCTRQALYVIVLHDDSIIVRLYCVECTRRLTAGVAKVMADNEIPLHDVLEIGNLVSDQVIV